MKISNLVVSFVSFVRRAGCAGLGALALAALAATPVRAAEPLNDTDMKFMTIYEQVQKALVTNNLNAAKDAAHALAGGEGDIVQNSKDIKAARDGFVKLSEHAQKIVAGNPDYHVFNCPMVNRDWVQKSPSIANPYMGADMLTCGVEKKK